MNLLFAADAIPAGSFTTDGGLFLNNVWLIPALPALSFVLILFFGKRMKFGGAEIGIATGKMHARGPVGAAQLTSFKYLVTGDGTIRN